MKVAISVPDPVFDAAERLAVQLKVSRSQLYSQALAAFLNSRGALAVTAQLDALYATESGGVDTGLATAQLQSIKHEAW